MGTDAERYGEQRRDVLLVEDDLRLARALSLALGDAGHAVRVAATVREADARLREREPDVVLLDLGLPDGDGLALCAAVRTRSTCRSSS
jgi:DNA-binding response OmpR family regulator